MKEKNAFFWFNIQQIHDGHKSGKPVSLKLCRFQGSKKRDHQNKKDEFARPKLPKPFVSQNIKD